MPVCKKVQYQNNKWPHYAKKDKWTIVEGKGIRCRKLTNRYSADPVQTQTNK